MNVSHLTHLPDREVNGATITGTVNTSQKFGIVQMFRDRMLVRHAYTGATVESVTRTMDEFERDARGGTTS